MKGSDDETRSLVAQTLQRFVAEQYDPAARLARLHQRPVDHRRHWPLLAGLGLPGLLVAQERGGLGGAAGDLASALLSLAPALALEPVEQVLLAAWLLGQAESPHLERVLSGEVVAVPVGIRPGEAALRLEPADGRWHLSGSCSVVPYAGQADRWIVAAQSPDGARLLAIAPESPGTTFRLMDGRPAADLRFDDWPVPEDAELLGPGRAKGALDAAADLWLTAIAADAVGIMEHVLGLTRDHLRNRVQFGVAIGSFQALQHRFADMHMVYLETRALLKAWTKALDDGAPQPQCQALRHALPRAVAKAGQRVGQESIQMHGGMGLTEELVVSHCNARLRVIASLLQGLVESGRAADQEAA